ncbi:uncharacterized protein EDB91DRAFT_1120295 [Suillus paluster]|uniref:uncharacterized protein n=1 Tax=Suillus paluster TaxID=48578 RepID=UPI001B87E20C|nr:uncharacterized protein EDB91DRAFT_1120295 [Suillus paluster]KAG1746027.1 hypothetical protein EDB91DRAFT_1120295 [Suillus paluster]
MLSTFSLPFSCHVRCPSVFLSWCCFVPFPYLILFCPLALHHRRLSLSFSPHDHLCLSLSFSLCSSLCYLLHRFIYSYSMYC